MALTPKVTTEALETSYRFSDELATLLTAFVYHTDGVDLDGVDGRRLQSTAINLPTSGLAAVFNDAAPIVMLIHDDADHDMVNPVEGDITHVLVNALNPALIDDDLTLGVVTPHNAQRGHLADRLPDVVTCNTVERFQGDERDVMIVSATVSNPAFARRESRFLLDARRLLVAISRSELLTVVVCSDRLLTTLPTRTEALEDGPLWARLFTTIAGRDGAPTWAGTLDAFAATPQRHPETNLAVYPYRPDR